MAEKMCHVKILASPQSPIDPHSFHNPAPSLGDNTGKMKNKRAQIQCGQIEC